MRCHRYLEVVVINCELLLDVSVIMTLTRKGPPTYQSCEELFTALRALGFSQPVIAFPNSSIFPVKKWSTPSTTTSSFSPGSDATSCRTFSKSPCSSFEPCTNSFGFAHFPRYEKSELFTGAPIPISFSTRASSHPARIPTQHPKLKPATNNGVPGNSTAKYCNAARTSSSSPRPLS